MECVGKVPVENGMRWSEINGTPNVFARFPVCFCFSGNRIKCKKMYMKTHVFDPYKFQKNIFGYCMSYVANYCMLERTQRRSETAGANTLHFIIG